jgi:hypothetical protein
MFETQTILEKMTENDISSDEYRPADGLITSLSQLSREQFLELISSDHPDARKYMRYAKKEYQYRNMSYQALNDFYRDRFLKE